MSTQRTDIFITWDEIQTHCTSLAQEILARKIPHDKILAITRGGLFPAGLLARELNIRRIETVGITAYDGTEVSIASLVKEVAPEFLEGTLIIDDLADTGTTLDFLRPSTRDCTFVTIFVKPQGKSRVDLYAREVAQDSWIRFPWDTRRQFVEPLVKGEK